MAERRDFYVYLHKDVTGRVFYVGKGTGRRAWSEDGRHEVWKRFVREQLNGHYEVVIIKDRLTEDEALDLEEDLISEHGTHLVNWFNPGRDVDLEALDQFHTLRGANRLFLAETKPYELSDPERAIERYRRALDNLREYTSLTLERGLVAELMDGPRSGEPVILDRLTLCLVALGRLDDARANADRYFAEYPTDRNSTIGQRILKRLEGRHDTIRRPGVSTTSTEHCPATRQKRTVRKETPARVIEGETERPYRPDLKVPKDQVERNLQGRELERLGLIDNAIELYWANVRDGFDGDGPYERLAVIYRRRKDRASEVAVLERAVEVFEDLMDRSPRSDVPIKLAKFRERLYAARRFGGGGA
jgi:tetratricopeptide (TPR) repeat protein